VPHKWFGIDARPRRLRRGTVIDGGGSPGTIGDIALAAGRIAALDPSLAGDANKVIDADGLAVTPGFIDIKMHSDFVLPINPKAESKVRQGVTTEIIGHCGFSVVPVLPGKTQLLAEYLSGGAPPPGDLKKEREADFKIFPRTPKRIRISGWRRKIRLSPAGAENQISHET
jgi:hypothetical protein